MECLPETGLSAGTTVAIVAIALALIALATILIIKSRRARTGTLMAIGLIGLLGALPLASAPNAAAGVVCNGQNAVYITSTATETVTATAPGATVTATETVTATSTAPGTTTTVTAPGATITASASPVTTTAPANCATLGDITGRLSTERGRLNDWSLTVFPEDTGNNPVAALNALLLRQQNTQGESLCNVSMSWTLSRNNDETPTANSPGPVTFAGYNSTSDNNASALGFTGNEPGVDVVEGASYTQILTGTVNYTGPNGEPTTATITLTGPFKPGPGGGDQ